MTRYSASRGVLYAAPPAGDGDESGPGDATAGRAHDADDATTVITRESADEPVSGPTDVRSARTDGPATADD
ncbi:hypothetical protein BRC90_03620 [Halobacteriales archaeon QS_4_69_34]|nr:MAG: hypothetical protein BRC90_03620 [Halobacteriales archaeon QS_4_69_34]